MKKDPGRVVQKREMASETSDNIGFAEWVYADSLTGTRCNRPPHGRMENLYRLIV